MKVSIRSATSEDATALAPLLSELGFIGNAETIETRLQFLLQDEAKLHIVAVEDELGIAGLLSAESRFSIQTGPFCELTALVVAPGARRRGVAKTLVEHAEQWADDHGLPALRVRSSVTRPESHPFYGALGFALLKTQHCYIRPCKPNDSSKPKPLRGSA